MKETLGMKPFYSIKNHFESLDVVSESGFVLQQFEPAINLAAMDVLCILGKQYIIGSNL